ncbi:MAG TPA: hypothetical protein VMS01_04110 [Stellaceae bacterium]|nr:hypothetical protein [Stellaceae bacterium]
MPEYSPRVELGHILQGGLFFVGVISVVLTIIFAVAPAWNALSARQAEIDARQAALTAAMGAMEAAISLRVTADEQRMDRSDQRMDRSDQERRDFEVEERAAVQKVLDAIALIARRIK